MRGEIIEGEKGPDKTPVKIDLDASNSELRLKYSEITTLLVRRLDNEAKNFFSEECFKGLTSTNKRLVRSRAFNFCLIADSERIFNRLERDLIHINSRVAELKELENEKQKNI